MNSSRNLKLFKRAFAATGIKPTRDFATGTKPTIGEVTNTASTANTQATTTNTSNTNPNQPNPNQHNPNTYIPRVNHQIPLKTLSNLWTMNKSSLTNISLPDRFTGSNSSTKHNSSFGSNITKHNSSFEALDNPASYQLLKSEKPHVLYINAASNNTHVHLQSPQGGTLIQCTAGMLGLRKANR